MKGQALGQLAGFAGRFPQRQPYGQGFSQMFGAGLQGLLGGGNDMGFLENIRGHATRGQELLDADPFGRLNTRINFRGRP